MGNDKENGELFSAIGNQVLGLKVSDEENEEQQVKVVDEIESLCMNCHENGVTRLLLTKIPFFREVILMSFFCEHCNFRNSEIQPAGEIQEQGSKFTFKVTASDDLQRQIVKSDTAIFKIEDVELEIPPGKGQLTNIEGIISEVYTGLKSGQDSRKAEDADTWAKLEEIISSLAGILSSAKLPVTVSLDDPAGNSSVEPNPKDTDVAGKYAQKHYVRTAEQNIALGLGEDTANGAPPETTAGNMEDLEILEGKTYDLPIACPGCSKHAHLLMQMVNIPHFKQVVLSTTHCDNCNYHVSDVKTGGEIPEKGKKITLSVQGPSDLQRDILKSDTCLLKVPECKVEVVPGTMGGRFSTVEGLLSQVRDDLHSSIFDTDSSDEAKDSMPAEKRKAWDEFFDGLNNAIKGEVKFKLILEDPLANSFCQKGADLGEDDEDPQIHIEDYTRTAEEEDELGLTDMRTHLDANGEYVREPLQQKVQADESKLDATES